MPESLHNRRCHRRTGGKVHVCHPHGNKVKAFLWLIRLIAPYFIRSDTVNGQGVLTPAVHDGSKIVFHVKSSSVSVSQSSLF